MVEELADGDVRRDGAIAREVAAHRVRQAEPALLDELEDGGRDVGLRHASDDERVGAIQSGRAVTVTAGCPAPEHFAIAHRREGDAIRAAVCTGGLEGREEVPILDRRCGRLRNGRGYPRRGLAWPRASRNDQVALVDR